MTSTDSIAARGCPPRILGTKSIKPSELSACKQTRRWYDQGRPAAHRLFPCQEGHLGQAEASAGESFPAWREAFSMHGNSKRDARTTSEAAIAATGEVIAPAMEATELSVSGGR